MELSWVIDGHCETTNGHQKTRYGGLFPLAGIGEIVEWLALVCACMLVDACVCVCFFALALQVGCRN